jgi:2-polyprenyl-6-methoxyphenol hydroxylase-like FAD-dependent oxidoreductase
MNMPCLWVFQISLESVSHHTEGKAWVVTDEGEVFKGDLVGADGVRSKARTLVLGYHDKPKSSGYAVYRAWFDAEAAGITTELLTREFVANGDTHTGCTVET